MPKDIREKLDALLNIMRYIYEEGDAEEDAKILADIEAVRMWAGLPTS